MTQTEKLEIPLHLICLFFIDHIKFISFKVFDGKINKFLENTNCCMILKNCNDFN